MKSLRHSAGMLLLGGLLGLLACGSEKKRVVSSSPEWPRGEAYLLQGLTVTLSAPVLVGRSPDYFWFPGVERFPNGDLIAVVFQGPDQIPPRPGDPQDKGAVCWSGDGGRTWTAPKDYTGSSFSWLALPSGDVVLLPYYLSARPGGMGAPCHRVPAGRLEIEPGGEVQVTNWPRPDEPFNSGVAGFVFQGSTVTLMDGRYLATLYGRFQGQSRFSVVAADSADGLNWSVRAVIADETCPLPGVEGPNEASLCRIPDGRLCCIFRVGADFSRSARVLYGMCWSDDEGGSWSAPVSVGGGFSVDPSLKVLPNGVALLSGGRPGIFCWFNADGTARTWEAIDVEAHHNKYRPEERIDPSDFFGAARTTSYTQLVVLDQTRALLIYDRVPKGWNAIPPGSPETNSVWVVHLTVERNPQQEAP